MELSGFGSIHLALELVISTFGRLFFGLFLGSGPGVCNDFTIEFQTYVTMFRFILAIILINIKKKVFFVFLAPFNEKTSITYNLSFQFLDVHIRFYDPFLDKFFAVFYAPVQINGSDQRFKDIPIYISTKLF